MTPLEALRACPLFEGFTETGLQIFAAVATARALPEGTPLFVEGMTGEALLVVARGEIRLSQRADAGDRDLGRLGAGEPIGGLSLLARSTRLVSAVAATDCEIVEIAQRDFTRLQAQKPQACLKLALAIAADLAARVADGRDALRELGVRRPAAS